MYNTGQTAIFLKGLNGQEYPVIAELTRKRRVNGQREISLSFLYTEINEDFIHDIEFGWKVLFDGEWYTITHPGYSTDGDFITVGVTAILSFFVDMNGFYLQDKVENKSNTPANYFTELFNGTPFNFILVDNLAANTFSYEDNQSKTERFLYGIDRFKAEYLIRDKTVYIYSQIGSDKDVILHEDLNINTVKIDVDASGFHTWAKGFGDLPDSTETEGDTEYQIEVEYRSPLISKYGAIEGPAFKDGNYKSAESLTEAVKNQVENSYKISTEVDAVDLTNNGYPEMILDEGDRVWLYVSKLNLNQQVRVMEVDETFDWEGKRIDVHYTLGNEGIASRYKTQQYDTLKDFQDILNGKKKIQKNWLPDAIQRASDIINGNQDSLFRYLPGEIIGINQSNPNGYMRFNTDGLGFSRDGGKTYRNAITYEGIVADAITAGTLRGILIEGVEVRGSTIISESSGTKTQISGGNFTSSGTFDRTFGNNRATYKAFIDSYDGALRARITEKLVNGKKVNTQERWLAFTDKAITTQRAIHSGSGDYNGARFIDFYADETLNGDVAGLSMHVYSGQSLTLESLYALDLRHSMDYMTNLTSGGLRINANNTGLVLKRITRYDTTEGQSIQFKSWDDTTMAIITQPNNNYNLHIYTKFGENIILGAREEIQIKDTEGIDYRPIRTSEVRNGSSITYKTNIDDLAVSGLDVINNLVIKQYLLQSDVDKGIYHNWQVGVISELSPEIATPDTRAVNLNTWLGYLSRSVQELSLEVNELKTRLADLEMIA